MYPTRMKRMKLQSVSVPLFLFVGFAFYLRTWIPENGQFDNLLKDDDDTSLCLGNNLALPAPLADGLVMKNNIPPNQWPPFNTLSETDGDRRIFFHETTGSMDLTMRQTCVVESAAKHNPHRPIHLFIRPMSIGCHNHEEPSPSSLFNPLWMDILSNYRNVKPILINENYYFSGSKLENWYKKGEWRQSPHSIYHLSDYVRIVTLNKGGGLYLDLDVLVLKSLNETILRNCLSYESAFSGANNPIGSTVMHLERGHRLLPEIMKLLSEEYDPQDFAYHGSQVVNAAMQSESGRDVRILASHFFFPVERPFATVLYQSYNDPIGIDYFNRSYGAHLWGAMSNAPLRIDSDQLLSVLARANCPLTFAKSSQFHSL